MPLENAERLYLERQISLARVTFVTLALVDLLVLTPGESQLPAAVFLTAYLVGAVALLAYERFGDHVEFQVPAVADVIVLGLFVMATPSTSGRTFSTCGVRFWNVPSLSPSST